jgi:hypothetical protein
VGGVGERARGTGRGPVRSSRTLPAVGSSRPPASRGFESRLDPFWALANCEYFLKRQPS